MLDHVVLQILAPSSRVSKRAPVGHVSGADEQLGGLMETGKKRGRQGPLNRPVFLNTFS